MQAMRYLIFPIIALSLVACQKEKDQEQVISQRFIHKYGFDLSPSEWESREQDGQVITQLDNGITLTQNFKNGILHGNATYTYPNSSTIEQKETYEEGTLIKKVMHDKAGIPIKEIKMEANDRKMVTFWNEEGAPLAFEEYENDLLIRGSYYNEENVKESSIEQGKGLRIKRDRKGTLLSKDKFENGQLTFRTTFHPNGEIASLTPFSDYRQHGKQFTFTPSGKPLMEMDWQAGLLHGKKIMYKGGVKVLEVPYIAGKKHGLEQRFDEIGNLIAEVNWSGDEKHGSSRTYDEESTAIDWFYKGTPVSLKKFQLLEFREQLIAEMEGNKDAIIEEGTFEEGASLE